MTARDEQVTASSMGRAEARREGRLKVRGGAPYAADVPVDDPLHAFVVQSTIARGRVTHVDADAALAHDGVVLVLDHTSAPRLAEGDVELRVLQDDAVAFRGQVVAVVVATSPEAAREGAVLVDVTYAEQPHEAEMSGDGPDLYRPEVVNPAFPTRTTEGDVDAALDAAPVVVDEVYRTPYEHNSPMEPHATTAQWVEGSEDAGEVVLRLHASTQSVHGVVSSLAPLFELEPTQLHVTSPFVGGGFGSKGLPHAHDVVAALAAKALRGRPVRLSLTRQQTFALVGYRTATIQRLRLGADATGTLLAIDHDVVEQTSRVKEFAEQTAVATRMMYAAPDRRTDHRLAPLDVAIPSWMRAPGEMPGMFAVECAMDELAVATGVDPVELRVRNEPEVDPESGRSFGQRRYLECLRDGAERFGWAARDPRPGATLDGDWLVGWGVAGSTYPCNAMPGSRARVEALEDGRYAVALGAADIGTGSGTVLAQIAADALEVEAAAVDVHLGDSSLPNATVAGGSSGTNSWGSAIVGAVRAFRAEHGEHPVVGATTEAGAEDNPDAEEFALHSFGAQFAEVRVNVWTGELRVPRLVGVFSAGRIVNPVLARSQFVGAMVMGLGSGLFEESVRDPRFGHVVTQDLASYHVASHADVHGIEAHWLDETDPRANPMGLRGIGEIGIVGTAAAVANAAFHATGVRVRELPLTADRFLDLPSGLPALQEAGGWLAS